MFSLGVGKQVREEHAIACALTSGGGLVQEIQGIAGNGKQYNTTVLLSLEEYDNKRLSINPNF